MTSTRITALIPCYNGAAYLARAIASVRAQTRPVDEVLVVDDCSTDDSVAVARACGATVIALAENAGPSNARNIGLAQARGDFVAFLDADDYWTPDHCALVGGLLTRTPTAVLAFGRVRFVQFPQLVSSDALSEERPIDALETVLRINPVVQSCVIVRRDAALDAGGYDTSMRYSEDYDLWLRLALVGPFICTHQITCWRELHAAQASRSALAMLRGAWMARRRALEAVQRTGDTARSQRAKRAVIDAWRYELRNGWLAEFPAGLDAALAMRAEFGLPALPYWIGTAARHALWRPRQVARRLWRRMRNQPPPDPSLVS